jgi:hypothetical protein
MANYIQQFTEWSKQSTQGYNQGNVFGQAPPPVSIPPFDPRHQDAEYMNHLNAIFSSDATKKYATTNEILNFAEGWANKINQKNDLSSLS